MRVVHEVNALVRDRRDVDPLKHTLARLHPNQVFGYEFPGTLSTPGGFINFYQGTGG